MLCMLDPSGPVGGCGHGPLGREELRGGMRIVIFGLTVSSSWGNGHATLWRGLCRALAHRGHEVVFFERDVPYYAHARDMEELPGGGRLVLYRDFEEIEAEAKRQVAGADLAITTSFCPDGRAAARLLLDSTARIRAFYDLDTPVTLEKLATGEPVEYLPEEGLAAFDLVLSYTGGRALTELQAKLGARVVVPLYGWVDPETHHPVAPVAQYRADLSYLGTYAEDRQAALRELFVEPAGRQPERRFLIGGAQYPEGFPWTENMFFKRHVPPAEHPAFFCSSRLTLNVTRRSMASYGYCPSGRLFEAAACGVALVSDVWEGLDSFFAFGHELIAARTCADVVSALELSDGELAAIARAAGERTLTEHTAMARVLFLEEICTSLPKNTERLEAAGVN